MKRTHICDEFKNVPHSLTFSPEMPMYKGLRHVRDSRFSLTSPSRFYFWSLPRIWQHAVSFPVGRPLSPC